MMQPMDWLGACRGLCMMPPLLWPVLYRWWYRAARKVCRPTHLKHLVLLPPLLGFFLISNACPEGKNGKKGGRNRKKEKKTKHLSALSYQEAW